MSKVNLKSHPHCVFNLKFHLVLVTAYPALFMRALAEWIVSPRCQHQPTGTALAA